MEKKFTVCMSFKNEGTEVLKTVKSIRDTAGDKVDIVVYNDASDDNIDYKEMLKDYNVNYYSSNIRLGSSLGKQTAINQAKTPYIFLLDAHSRIYTENWLEIATEIMEMEESKNTLYCCICQYFRDDTDHMNDSLYTKAYGAVFSGKYPILHCASWNITNLSSDNKPFDVPAIMGANYIFSKEYWDFIKGYQGLQLYGREEEFISLKYLLAGGSVKCIPTIHTGHKHRQGIVPYVSYLHEVYHNEMAINYICNPDNFNTFLKFIEQEYYANKVSVVNAVKKFKSHINELSYLQLYQRTISTKKI